jgi:hypothetical protein
MAPWSKLGACKPRGSACNVCSGFVNLRYTHPANSLVGGEYLYVVWANKAMGSVGFRAVCVYVF